MRSMQNRNFSFWLFAFVVGSVLNAGLFLVLPNLGRSEPVAKPEIISVEFRAWQQPVAKLPVLKPKPEKKQKPPPKKVKPKPKPLKKPKPKIKPPPKPVKKPVLTEKITPEKVAPLIEEPEEPEPDPLPQVTESPQVEPVEAAMPTPVPVFKLTSMPRVVHQGSLVYPPAMREQGREAIVKLEILLDVKGKIRRIEVIKSGGAEFDQAAVESMKNSIFLPGNVNGKPVAVLLKKKIRFRLN